MKIGEFMASNRSKLFSLINLIQKLDSNDLKIYIKKRSSFLMNVMSFEEYTLINDGDTLPWELEIITMCYLMSDSHGYKASSSIQSIKGKNVLKKIRYIIKTSQDDFNKENLFNVLSKMMIQQSEYQRQINNIIYRYSFLYNFTGTDPTGKKIDISSSFKSKFGYTYDEHENYVFISYILSSLYKKENIEEVLQKFFNHYNYITQNISKSVSQINKYQTKELEKVNYDWVYVFKTVNVFPVISKEYNQYELILPHRLIYSLTDGFVNKFTRHSNKNRRNLGYAIQDYLYTLIKTSKYFDYSIPDQIIDSSPDVICVKDGYLICFESKLHVFGNVVRSLSTTEIDTDYLKFVSQVENSYEAASSIAYSKTKSKIHKENTYYVICVLESSKINLKIVIDEYAKINGFLDTDKERVEYLYNHIVIVDFNVIELFFMYNECSFISELVEMKSSKKSRFDFFAPKGKDRKLLMYYLDNFSCKYDKLYSVIEESAHLFL